MNKEVLKNMEDWDAKNIVKKNGIQLNNGEEIEIKLEENYSILIQRDKDKVKIIKRYPIPNGPDDTDYDFEVDLFKLKY